MIRAELDEPRMADFDANRPAHSLQTVRIEFDVITEYGLEVLQRMLKHLNDELTRPVAHFDTPTFNKEAQRG